MKKIAIGLLVVASLFASCESDPTTLNVDPKNPTEVNVDYVFASAEVNLVTRMSTPSVNSNNFRFFTQQITETQYTDEAKYNLVKRSVPDSFWNSLYTQLNKLETVETGVNNQAIDAQVKANKLATVEALKIYIYSVLVDTYGDIPYSQAIKVDLYPSPKYDDALTIYKDLITRIDNVLPKFNNSASFAGDAIFKNSTSNTKLFLNTLKLRMGLNLADVDNAYAKTVVESAVAAGVINSNSLNIGLKFDSAGLFTSPVYQELVSSGRNDFVAANTLVDVMNANNDPRREKYFTTVGGIFKGGTYGATNNYALFSHFNDAILVPNATAYLFDYAETEFMIAEAIERGYNVGGTASIHFLNGINASMDFWGVSALNKATYLAANDYTTLPGAWKVKIGTQAWLATYNRGFESWEFSRRLDFKNFIKPSTFALPLRMPYPVKEGSVNNTNRTAAAIKQWTTVSGDTQGSKVFWDKF